MFRHVTSAQNDFVKHLVRLRQNSDYRYNCQSVIVEGLKPIKELLTHMQPKNMVALDAHLVPANVPKEAVTLVTEAIMHKISGMLSPEGLLAEFPMPHFASLDGMRRIIALDAVQEPGNLGSIMRSALALGWEGVFLIGENCDPYNEKALRAARGATFRLPHIQGSWSQLKELIHKNGLLALQADLAGKKPQDIDTNSPILLMLSNEAHGASLAGEQLCQKLTIPLCGDMESLNVAAAGAILMYLLK